MQPFPPIPGMPIIYPRAHLLGCNSNRGAFRFLPDFVDVVADTCVKPSSAPHIETAVDYRINGGVIVDQILDLLAAEVPGRMGNIGPSYLSHVSPAAPLSILTPP